MPSRKPFSNNLTDAELERLAILSEELGETQQIIGKIIRHGYESSNSALKDGVTNRSYLEREVGHIIHAIRRLTIAHDINVGEIVASENTKALSIKQWLHHQEISLKL